jgi:hypothetical protein
MADNQEQSSYIDSSVNTVVEKPSELSAQAHVEDASERDPPHQYRHGSENVPPYPHGLFRRQKTLYDLFGGGKAADVILWKKWTISAGILVGSTVTWALFEWSGYRPLSLIANVLLLLVAIFFIWAKAAGILKRPPPPLPGLVLSEEMVNSTAASVRLRINHTLAAAHDIALGKDFSLFAKVVVCLWLFSVVSSWFDLITLVYIIVLVVITIPALYNNYGDHVDRHALIVEQEFKKHYKKFDESVIRRILPFLSGEKSIDSKEKKRM